MPNGGKIVSVYFTSFTATNVALRSFIFIPFAGAEYLKCTDIGKLAKEGKTRT